jgi:hypothetical protein
MTSTANLIGNLRPYLDVPTSMLHNIKKNLSTIIKSELVGVDPMDSQVMKLLWTEEMQAINYELVQRN